MYMHISVYTYTLNYIIDFYLLYISINHPSLFLPVGEKTCSLPMEPKKKKSIIFFLIIFNI